ncbi:mechanosensitive ion channel family protein [Hoeflea sp. TYP-13]|uniref:mechanosensitive ion channel family protein n=1 Tax=Hoeflea sp. TYP-13 TaxID=3230023 RepID=UPI0034C5CB14
MRKPMIVLPVHWIAAILLIVTLGSHPSKAQVLPGTIGAPQAEEETTTPPPSPNDVRELMRLLSDQSMVEWLRTQSENPEALGTLEPALSLTEEFANRVAHTRTRIGALVVSWRNLSIAPQFLINAWQSELSADDTLRSMTYVLIFLVVGGGLEWLYRQYTQVTLLRLELRHGETLAGRFQAAIMRAVTIFGGLAVFSAGAIGGFLSFDWPPFIENLVLNLLVIIITIRSAATLSLFVLAPRVASLRLVPLSTAIAQPLHYWLIGLVSLATIAFAISDIFTHLAGATDAVGAALAVSIISGLVCAALLVIAIWHMASIIRRHTNPGENVRKGRIWPTYLTVLVLIAVVLWMLAAITLMWTVLIVGLVLPVTRLLSGCVNHLFDQAEGLNAPQPDEPAATALSAAALPQETATDLQTGPVTTEEAPPDADPEESDEDEDEVVGPLELYRPVARRFARFVVLIGALLALLYVWSGGILSLSDSQTFTGRFIVLLADIIAAVLIADLIWVWAKSAIDRRLANYIPPQPGEAPGPEARMATLLPILRVTLFVFLVVIVVMTVLASFGINIGPLLAGAGVIGIAIGFGAQALVRDIVSGIFFLIDDAFRIGEYIEIGELRGTVESMSIRSLRVRHHLGAIHTIPFGELKSLTNYSRDWVIMRLEFRVPFDTDIKLVKKIVKKIGAELLEHEGYGESIIQTLKSQGVRRMEEFNMVIGVKFMAKPGAQWLIRRDAYMKLRDAFEANGINFAQRNVTVEVVGDKPLGEEDKKAIAAAAQPAIESAGAAGPAPDEP